MNTFHTQAIDDAMEALAAESALACTLLVCDGTTQMAEASYDGEHDIVHLSIFDEYDDDSEDRVDLVLTLQEDSPMVHVDSLVDSHINRIGTIDMHTVLWCRGDIAPDDTTKIRYPLAWAIAELIRDG
jgi:hypothetical protein